MHHHHKTYTKGHHQQQACYQGTCRRKMNRTQVPKHNALLLRTGQLATPAAPLPPAQLLQSHELLINTRWHPARSKQHCSASPQPGSAQDAATGDRQGSGSSTAPWNTMPPQRWQPAYTVQQVVLPRWPCCRVQQPWREPAPWASGGPAAAAWHAPPEQQHTCRILHPAPLLSS